MHIPGADLDHEEAVQALQGHRAVHVEEVGCKHRRGLRAQELPPRRIGAPLRRRRDLQRLEDPADRRRANPVADLEQLTLDPLVSPAVVLEGEPLDERGDLGADRRPSRPVRIGPLPGDQAAVPAQDGAGGGQPVCSQPCRQEPDQRGHHRPGRPSPASASGSAAAAPRLPGAAPEARRPSKPKSVPASSSSRSGGRTSNTASVPSRTRDPARQTPLIVGKSPGQPTSRSFGTPHGRVSAAREPFSQVVARCVVAGVGFEPT